MRATALPRAALKLIAVGALALGGVFVSVASAQETQVAIVEPIQISPNLEAQRLSTGFGTGTGFGLRPSFSAQPELTNDLLAAYVSRQQALKTFTAFDTEPDQALTQQVLMGYIDRTRGTDNQALDAIDDMAGKPALNADLLASYAATKFVPTEKKVKLSRQEQLCLAQAIYHEARGESEKGQWAVANVIINRAMSKKFPSTLCGVVFQNADQGRYRCQFSFACDGKSDFGTETAAWNRATRMAQAAYREFAQGERPGVVPNSVLYYHTTSVSPDWSDKFRRVATIGAHQFYSVR